MEVVVLPFPHPGYLLQSPALCMEPSVLIQVRELTRLKTNPTEKKSMIAPPVTSHLLSGSPRILTGLPC